jgi:hypothetical protein
MHDILQQAIDNFDLSDLISTMVIILLLAVIMVQSRVRIVIRSGRTNFY